MADIETLAATVGVEYAADIRRYISYHAQYWYFMSVDHEANCAAISKLAQEGIRCTIFIMDTPKYIMLTDKPVSDELLVLMRLSC